jgi:hypothetical protein
MTARRPSLALLALALAAGARAGPPAPSPSATGAPSPARVLTLLVSDVPGDRPGDIASGPTVADPTSCADALDIVRRYGI